MEEGELLRTEQKNPAIALLEMHTKLGYMSNSQRHEEDHSVIPRRNDVRAFTSESDPDEYESVRLHLRAYHQLNRCNDRVQHTFECRRPMWSLTMTLSHAEELNTEMNLRDAEVMRHHKLVVVFLGTSIFGATAFVLPGLLLKILFNTLPIDFGFSEH